MGGYSVSASKKNLVQNLHNYYSDQWWSYTIYITYRKKGLQKIP